MNKREMVHVENKGFTLIELLVSMTILLFVIAGVYTVYTNMKKTWLAEDLKAELQQTTRVAMDSMVREMMMMGFGVSDSDNKITIATQHVLEFKEYNESDLKTYYIKYHVDANHNLVRDTAEFVVGASYPPTYQTSDQIILAENVENLSLSYSYAGDVGAPYDQLDGPYVDSSNTGDQPNRNEIRRIVLSLTLKSAKSMPRTDPTSAEVYKTMTLTADLSPRNLWEGEMTLDDTPPVAVTGLEVVDVCSCDPQFRLGGLKLRWNKSPESDVVEYLIQYGQSAGGYFDYKEVPVSSLSDPDNPEYVLDVPIDPYVGDHVMYYVNVQAYDRSHNPSPLMSVDVFGDHTFPNITAFGMGSDTKPNPRRPSAPVGFTAARGERSIILSWSPPDYGSDAVIGYRIYRSYSSILSSDLPLDRQTYDLNSGDRTIQLANEDSIGDYPSDRVLNADSTSFTDDDPNLMGCRDYYYTICAVTCDGTRIMGNGAGDTLRYGPSQYAFTEQNPDSHLAPEPPAINTGTQPGWKRVFIQHRAPVVNADGSTPLDYAYTRLFYTSSPIGSEPATPTTSSNTVPSVADVDIDGDGTADAGTVKVNKTVVFNDPDVFRNPDDPPNLPENSKFAILAVAYNNCGWPSDTSSAMAFTLATLCGDDPLGYPRWPGCGEHVPVVSFLPNTTDNALTLDSSKWITGPPRKMPLHIEWQGLNTTDTARTKEIPDPTDPTKTITVTLQCPAEDPIGMPDFQGYTVRQSTSPSFATITDWRDFPGGDTMALWDEAYDTNPLDEGEIYYFCIQSTDCYFWSHDNATDNISPNFSVPVLGIKPGRLAKYDRSDTMLSNPEYYVASTSGQFHNKVKLFIENTSRANLRLDAMRLRWDNTAAFLKSVTITPVASGTQQNVALSVPGDSLLWGTDSRAASVNNINFNVENLATGKFNPSNAIEVLLEFKTSTDGVSLAADMRGRQLAMEFQFTNPSIMDSGGTILSGFTTGDYQTDPIYYNVTEGVTFNSVKQNEPEPRTAAFPVDTAATGYTGPAGSFPQINGGTDVTVTADLSVPSNESLSNVTLSYVQVPNSTIDPFGLTFTNLSTTTTGTLHSAVIPGVTDQGVWYYLTADTAQGNSTRSPLKEHTFYYYKQLPFDPCLETPTAPTSLVAAESLGNVSLEWQAPVNYTDGDPIPIYLGLDSLTYNVYRRDGLNSWDPVDTLVTGWTGTTFTDSTYSMVSANPVVYWVTASNSCGVPAPTDNESIKSNEATICPILGGGCSVTSSAADVYAGDSVTLYSAICSAANNGFPGQAGYFTVTVAGVTQLLGSHSVNFDVTEIGDTGTVEKTITTSHSSTAGADLHVVANGATSDTLTVGISSSTCTGITATVNVYMNPADNVPAAPTITTPITRAGPNVTLGWTAVTLNTDGSAANYTAGSLAGDSIVGYEVWTQASTSTPTLLPTETNNNGWTILFSNSSNTSTVFTGTTADDTISAGTTKYYIVRALDTVGQGTFSGIESVTRP